MSKSPNFSIHLLHLANAQVGGVSADNAQGVGVTHTTLPALDDNDGVALSQGAELDGVGDSPLDTLVDILLPVDSLKVGLLLGIQERVDATIQVAESRGGGASGDHEDGADGAVLGQQAGGVTRGGQDNDTASGKIERGADSSHGARLDRGNGALHQGAKLLEVGDVGNGVLSLQTGLVHLVDGLGRVVTLGSLTGKHDAVSAIGDGVTNVADLGTSRTRVLDHGLEHLGSADNWLAGDVAHGNHLLLGSKDLSGRNLDTEITTGDHDTVSGLENLGKVVETLSVLNLGNDLDVLALRSHNVTDVLDVLGTTDK